jgi:protein SCO1
MKHAIRQQIVTKHALAALALAAVAALASLTLAGCARQAPYALRNISGLLPSLQFQLTDDHGAPVSAQSYRGDVVLLYFGYTHCPDVCPTTLATLAQALRALGPSASKVRVLFVSVDPQRDSAAVLKQYAAYFGPQFVGLFGPDSALTPIAHRYRVAYHRDPPDAYGNYAVQHSSAVFIFDQRGRVRLLADESDGAAAISSDLRRLLAEG